MRYIYLGFIAALVFWATHNLQVIYNFSSGWVFILNVLLVVYFAFLLEIELPIKKVRQWLKIW